MSKSSSLQGVNETRLDPEDILRPREEKVPAIGRQRSVGFLLFGVDPVTQTQAAGPRAVTLGEDDIEIAIETTDTPIIEYQEALIRSHARMVSFDGRRELLPGLVFSRFQSGSDNTGSVQIAIIRN